MPPFAAPGGGAHRVWKGRLWFERVKRGGHKQRAFPTFAGPVRAPIGGEHGAGDAPLADAGSGQVERVRQNAEPARQRFAQPRMRKDGRARIRQPCVGDKRGVVSPA